VRSWIRVYIHAWVSVRVRVRSYRDRQGKGKVFSKARQQPQDKTTSQKNKIKHHGMARQDHDRTKAKADQMQD
jgi:hypothetical protein